MYANISQEVIIDTQVHETIYVLDRIFLLL